MRKTRSAAAGQNAARRLGHHVLSSPLANKPLSNLTGDDFDSWRMGLRRGGRGTPRDEPLTPSTLARLFNDFRAALSGAARKAKTSGELLAIASDQKTDQMKLVHLPSCTVFTNWPTDRTPVRKVTCLDFSPGGAYLAIGNSRGRVLLYRLKHYCSA